MARADPARAGLTVRCAIYTRKSSGDGLEQEFNSLDAQREACEAYIVSQRHAGWVALPDMYDDGGLSGGTMERPALKRLLEDIQAGKVQTVVVYKVDRLTRSLADFAKIVDVLDAHSLGGPSSIGGRGGAAGSGRAHRHTGLFPGRAEAASGCDGAIGFL
jgi:site-specific DNA recombinase